MELYEQETLQARATDPGTIVSGLSDLRRTAFAPNPAAVEDYGLILRNRSFTYVFFWHFLLFTWLPSPVAYEAEAAGPKRWPVGGWGATYEEVEANRIQVTGVGAELGAEPAE